MMPPEPLCANCGSQETTWAAANLLRQWIEQYGIPQALYTDWKNVYVRPASEAEKAGGQAPLTQFGGMCSKLGIRIIAASSPQAKGRVERNHGTHQDRLIKKLRRQNLCSYRRPITFLGKSICRSTTSATAGQQLRRKIFIVPSRVCVGWRKSSAWKRSVPSAMIGWCATAVVCCRFSAIVIITLPHGPRL